MSALDRNKVTFEDPVDPDEPKDVPEDIVVEPDEEPVSRVGRMASIGPPKKDELVSIWKLLSLVPGQKWRLIIGSLAAMGAGVIMPLFCVVFGDLFNSFVGATDADSIKSKARENAIKFIVLGAFHFVGSYLQAYCFTVIGEHISRKLRADFFAAVMRQETAFFDATPTGELTNGLSSDIVLVQNGVSEKLGQNIYFLTQALGGIVVAFVYGWKMTLVLIGMAPLIAGATAVQQMFLQKQSKNDPLKEASNIAEEVFSLVRTVFGCVGEKREVERYHTVLSKATRQGERKAHIMGVGLGTSFLMMFGTYALGFWFGATLVAEGEMEGGDTLVVFFAIVVGGMAAGQASQLSPDFTKARSAATQVFKVLSREPDIISGTQTLDKVRGHIKFEAIDFAYPTRDDVLIFEGLNLVVEPGQTLAVVGPSGSGKSTLINLIERFYDPIGGHVYIDGVDVKDLDFQWLRTQIGLVEQEPDLFEGTIRDNIRYGKWDATEEEIYAAAQIANANEFIKGLKNGMDTCVGERGGQLSGGQKQRIAIARAIIKDPKILLLDEATSALDSTSEQLVQEALDKAMKGRTCIVIAHRLATITGADKIAVVSEGKVVEAGSHVELLKQNGLYSRLIKRQMKEEQKLRSQPSQVNLTTSQRRAEFQRKPTAQQVTRGTSFWRTGSGGGSGGGGGGGAADTSRPGLARKDTAAGESFYRSYSFYIANN